MDPLSIAASIAGLVGLSLEVSRAVGSYYRAAKDASKSIRDIQTELALINSTLEELKELLQCQQLRDSSFAHSSVLMAAVKSCTQIIRDILAKIQTSKQDGSLRTREILKWPFSEKDVEKRLEALRRHTSTFQFALTVEGCKLLSRTAEDAASGLQVQLETSQKVLDLTRDIGTMAEMAEEALDMSGRMKEILLLINDLHEEAPLLRDLPADVSAIKSISEETKAQQILDWVCPNIHASKHNDIRATRLSGTGQWLLESKPFQEWLTGTKPVIWCTGDPGVGKSFITSHVIDHIFEKGMATNEALAYIYFDYREQNLQTPAYFLSSLLRQLAGHTLALPREVLDLYNRSKQNQAKASTTDLLSTFRDVCITFQKCYIVIDALDECNSKGHRKEVLKILKSLDLSIVNLYVTTRPHHQHSEEVFTERVNVEIKANAADVELYCYRTMENDDDFIDITDLMLRKEVAMTVSSSAQGMFLLPVLQMQAILDAMTRSGIRRSLRDLPTNLGQAFDETLHRINNEPPNRRQVALRSLMFILRARRPLFVHELCHALATSVGATQLDKDDLLLPKTIVECCFGLVAIDDESSTVRLVHYTLQDYLLSQYQHKSMADETDITNTCLTYLCLEKVQEPNLLQYAAIYWGFHAQLIPVVEIRSLALMFLRDKAAMTRAKRSRLQLAGQRSGSSQYVNEVEALNIAAGFGLVELLNLLMNEVLPNTTTISHGTTPLHEAAINGHLSAVIMLLERGVEVNALDDDFNTPLYLAVAKAHDVVSLQLLKSGADPNFHCLDNWTALHKAADEGNTSVLMMLIDHGASVHSASARGLTALHRASGRGHLAAMRLLLDRRCLVDPTTHDEWTPLHGASSSGQHEAVNLLIKMHATVDFQSADGYTPLHRACRGGHYLTVLELLNGGADIMKSDCKSDIPLHRAAKAGHEAIAQLLLDRFPSKKLEQLSALGFDSRTPRNQALESGHWQMAQFLQKELFAASNLDPANESDEMQKAIEDGDLVKVVDLLDQGSNVNAHSSSGLSPLHLALFMGNEDIARMLLENNADISATTADGWLPLHSATKTGLASVVQLCLDHGADITVRTANGHTALHQACKVGSVATARILLEKGADIEAQDRGGWRPLHTAAAAGFEDVVKLLLQQGADVEASTNQDDTVQYCAARGGHHDLVEFLRMESLNIDAEYARAKMLGFES